MNKKIDVLLVDDHMVVRAGYKVCLNLSDQIGKIYEADRSEAACQLYSQHRPHVVIMDLSMPGIGGLEGIRRLVSRDAACKILVFSIYNDLVYVDQSLNAGAKGYITKNSNPETLINAVSQLAAGQTYIEPAIAQKLVAHHAFKANKETDLLQTLSPREFDIFCLLAQGLTNRDAAEKLCLSYKTVCNHATSIREKLELKTLAEFSLLAIRKGII